MSAAGRGKVRNESDFYPTPKWCVHRLLEEVDLPRGRWLEPCAGEGSIIRAVNEKTGDVAWDAIELRDKAAKRLVELPSIRMVACDDFLTWTPPIWKYQVVITNPPFSLAQEVIEKSFDVADTVVMLLRLNFLESEKRWDFIYQYVPDVAVLPNRPSFGLNNKGKRGTDATGYGWFIWPPGEREHGKLIILGQTPIAVRNAQWEETLRIIQGEAP